MVCVIQDTVWALGDMVWCSFHCGSCVSANVDGMRIVVDWYVVLHRRLFSFTRARKWKYRVHEIVELQRALSRIRAVCKETNA